MLLPLAFSYVVLLPQNDISHAEIVIQHRKIAQFMREGWNYVAHAGADISQVKVSTDTDKNALELDGPAGTLRAIRDAITFFDVAPKQVHLDLTTAAPEYGLQYSTAATFENNSSWDSYWNTQKALTSIGARINDDGTITLRVAVEYAGLKDQTFERAKSGQLLRLYLVAGKLVKDLDAKADLYLTLKTRVIETTAR